MATRTPHRNPLGGNIRKARNNAGITQRDLAHIMGYKGEDAGAYISRVEAGTQQPRLDNLLKIATALRVSLDSLIKR